MNKFHLTLFECPYFLIEKYFFCKERIMETLFLIGLTNLKFINNNFLDIKLKNSNLDYNHVDFEP